MKKYFNIGDRVRYSGLSDAWMENGEAGTVVGYHDDYQGDLINVEWDKRRTHRHDCGRKCKDEHGWNVRRYNLSHDIPADFGEFAAPDSIEELFTL